MNESTELQLMAGGLRLAALQWGDPDGRRVLALHGWMDNAASFQALSAKLPDCLMVALELPGHGHSDSGGDWFAFLDNLVVIHQARQALGWDRCVVMGHSMGGGLAALYAATFPDVVQALVSLDAYGPLSGDSLRDQLRKAVEARDGNPQQRHFSAREKAVEARTHRHFPRECAAVLAARGVVETVDGWTWRADRRLKWPSLLRLSEDHARQALQAITMPHLLLRASQVMYPEADRLVRRRVERFAPTRSATIEAGHHLHMEQPAACAQIINPFLEQHGGE